MNTSANNNNNNLNEMASIIMKRKHQSTKREYIVRVRSVHADSNIVYAHCTATDGWTDNDCVIVYFDTRTVRIYT